MLKRGLWVCLLSLAAACGGSDSSKKAPAGGGEANLPDPVEQRRLEREEAEKRAMRKAELRVRKTELAVKVKEAEAELAELEKKQEEERAALPPKSKVRRHYAAAKRDAAEKVTKLERMEKRLKELEGFAKSKDADDLKDLRKTREGIQERYEEALSGWKQSIADSQHGVVDASPVKRDLDTIRAMKIKWFEATPAARRGNASASAQKIINDGFRAWLNERPERMQLCTRVLSQPGATGTPASYDFCDLRFFLLLEVLENQLDLQNVAVEKKELTATETRLQNIQSELDALDDKISLKMQAGGPEFEEFLDIQSRIKTVRNITDELVRSRDAWEQLYEQSTSIGDRQEKERASYTDAVDTAKRELVEVDRELRSLGG